MTVVQCNKSFERPLQQHRMSPGSVLPPLYNLPPLEHMTNNVTLSQKYNKSIAIKRKQARTHQEHRKDTVKNTQCESLSETAVQHGRTIESWEMIILSY